MIFKKIFLLLVRLEFFKKYFLLVIGRGVKEYFFIIY